ncbi:MAG: prolyl oligopeptidase family serine peptidase [Planctomycetaceae bacterium]
MPRIIPLLLLLLTGFARLVSADDAAPTAEQRAELRAGLEKLQSAIERLPATGPRHRQQREDVAVYAKAVEWILRHDEWFKPGYVDDTRKVIAAGLERAAALTAKEAKWGTSAGKHILAYRSSIDGSLQPYAITLPEGFDQQPQRRWPLYIVLHGRNGNLNEVNFIRSFDGKPAPPEQTWIQIDVYGRGNNAFRWAGESDIFEALRNAELRYPIDSRRITLWGFSMGGAGAWHLGLHHPSRWSSVGAGAGFVDYYKYQKKTEQLPDWQHRALRIYDAVDYTLNLSVVPFITYGGENDSQLLASLTVKEAAEELDVPLEVLVGPGMGHKFDDASLAKFMAFHAKHSEGGRKTPPGQRTLRFTTSTLKYNHCEWLRILELLEQYEPATVESRFDDDGVLKVSTRNVAAMCIARGTADRVRLDGGSPVALEPAADGLLADVYFEMVNGAWRLLDYDASLAFEENEPRRKRHGLQGPIDDAFMQPFLCVRGTGEPWSPALDAYAQWSLARFEAEFDKWMRGKVPVIDDDDLTEEQVAGYNLVLIGDPGSNSILAKVVGELPIEWTADNLVVNGEVLDPSKQAVVMIYPNPLNPRRYVVINTGMSTHEADFKASNAWLFPKLGDASIIRFERKGDGYVETIEQGFLFDGRWGWETK